jgi:hypothetical protein
MANSSKAKVLSFLLFFLSSQANLAQETPILSEENKPPLTKAVELTQIPIIEETSSHVVEGVIERRDAKPRDLINFIARIDEERIDDREKYSQLGYLEGFCQALEDEINEDPFFWAWQSYEPNDFILKRQTLNALWNLGVAKHPRIFGRAEKAGKIVKRNTTLRHKLKGYEFQINPELDNEDYVKLRVKIRSPHKISNNIVAKLCSRKVEIGKKIYLNELAERMSISFDAGYKFEENEIYARVSYKMPLWFK